MIGPAERKIAYQSVKDAVAQGARQREACALIGLSARTLQRWQAEKELGIDKRTERRSTPAQALSPKERAEVLAVANSAEFGHLPPSQIVPQLADRGRYIASEATFYRILKAEQQLAHRRAERPAKPRAKPRTWVATGPNQLYSWDITYLPTLVKGQFFYLYLFMDIFSRKIVGWEVHAEEDNLLAARALQAVCAREGISPGQLVLHSDNGSPMKGATMLATLQRLGVMPSFSRPAVSNDNPFSEALFKTLKYCPRYPEKPFADLGMARSWVEKFVHWYNHEHRHSAIRFVTPVQRHENQDIALLAQRKAVYEAAKQQHPQRWSGSTRNWSPIVSVTLNPNHKEPLTTEHKEDTTPEKRAA
jgi:putative transposase